MKTLKLFNAVVSKNETLFNNPSMDINNGLIIESNARWAKDKIVNYYDKERLSGNELNKTFHKSWIKIKHSSRFELYLEQIKHYISTYGSNFNDEVYIPIEILELKDNIKLTFKVIKAYTKDEMTNKCLALLKSGIALKEETIDDLISILVDELDYKFTGNEGIKNKEAIVKIAEMFNVFPNNQTEFFRYIIYRTTNQSLLIKNKELFNLIKISTYNPALKFKQFGLEKLAEIFNRFKPLFLSYKTKCPKTINKISKLSKKYHKPLIENPLNKVTSRYLTDKDEHWLNNATIFSIFKALTACYMRVLQQDSFIYRIRNGKSFVKENNKSIYTINKSNYNYLFLYLINKIRHIKDKTFYFPEDIEYSLPTSEKMFVGNIPTGTKFMGEKLAVGIYWENSWGATDLDLSGINIGGKVGWNSLYNQNDKLFHSGDITSAPNGAVEYLYADKQLNTPTLVQNNVFYGENNCEYKIIIGKGDDINNNYMMNPENLFAEIKCKSVQQQTILGMLIPQFDNNKKQSFVLLNFGAGNCRVSGTHEVSKIATNALYQQWKQPVTFKSIIEILGGKVVETNENVDYDFSLENLEKDSFIKVFEK